MKFTLQDMVESALLVATAVVLGFVKVPIPPMGTISFSFIPLMIIALRNKPFQTFIYTGLVYGFIDCLLDGWGFSTFPLEYLLAVGGLCIISIFRKQLFSKEEDAFVEFGIVIGTILVWTLLRFFLCSLDGFLHGWAISLGQSMALNAPNVFTDTGFCLAVLIPIYLPLRRMNVEKYNQQLKAKK